jgi:hypothetical protein
LDPGQEATLPVQAPGRSTWQNLADWGYDLRDPGQYTIIGRAWSRDAAPWSNRATFRIEP